MAFYVNFLSFTKRENSTKVPTSAQISAGWRAECILIDDTSIMTPTFKIERSGSSMISYNYCYVSTFNRYYFITDIRSHQNFWYVSCACDVLATYKSTIGSSSHYVLRSASESDGLVIDTIYPAKALQHLTKMVAPNPISWSGGHSYVMGIVGYAPSADKQTGSVTYYHMSESCLQAFIYYLMHDVELWSDISTAEYDPAVQEALLNPIQYIVSCIALPVDPPATSTVSSIYFGYYEYGVSTGTIAAIGVGSSITETTDISLPKHPQASARGNYMNGAPFTSYSVMYGPFGNIPLDPSIGVDMDGIRLILKYDLISGNGRLVIVPTYSTPAIPTNRIMFQGCAQVGVEINLSQVIRNPLDYSQSVNNTVNGFTQNLTSLASGNVGSFFGALQGVFNGIADATRLKYPTFSGKGSNGSFISLTDTDYNCYLLFSYYDVVDDNNTELGRPLCKVKQINTLSGYILCSGADCQITGTQEEAVKINQYMNTGFFYE